ncbi:MAG: sulfite exporter TauE/SafE family protein [Firmicutes bacterium]|nr:sulfite exporter TauE/SafE family protein [Bacillota bacterium]
MDEMNRDDRRTALANYVTGAVGAILGAALGALPTLIIGLFGFVSGWLGILTAFVSMKGYQLFRGPRKSGYAFAVIILFSVLASTTASFILYMLYDMVLVDSYMVWFFLLPIVFTFFGAVFCKRGLTAYTQPELLKQAMKRAAQDNERRQQEEGRMILYPAEKSWMRPLRVSILLGLFVALLVMVSMAGVGAVINEDSMVWVMALIGSSLGVIAMVFCMIPIIGLLQANLWMYVRTKDGVLWRIQLGQLNRIDNYRFTMRTGAFRAIQWHLLSEAEQEMAEDAIFRGISDLRSGRLFPGAMVSQAVVAVKEPYLIKETKWAWKLSYERADGKRKRLKIAKAYPDLAPLPRLKPVTEPVPYRVRACIIPLVMVGIFTVTGGAFGYWMEGGFTESWQERAGDSIEPERSSRYVQDAIYYKMDADFIAEGNHVYFDEKERVEFTVEVAHEQKEEDALDLLLEPIGEARFDKDFDHFRFACVEEDLGELEAANGQIYGYNIVSIFYKDGRRLHTGVALTEEGDLLLVAAKQHREGNEDEVVGKIRYIIGSMSR